ncbi:MAG: NAD(P)-dependent oxidoreductase [Candidatus Omnitrophica bacterium]|nr:NAD(P)-dependent oxidoreductase [Candidatus Omnitrophota bacterium]
MKVLVTGATGFIGGNIVEDLVKEGHEVFALVRKTSSMDHLASLGVKFVFGDITDKDSLYAITGKFDAVFHCAAYVGDKNWKKLKSVNIGGTESVCKLALRLSVERLIYLSSVAVVSGHFQVPLTEDLSYSATNLYGESKIEAERIVWDFRRKGLPSAILRPSMVYGENEPHLLKSILFLIKHRLFPIVGGGKNKLHLSYVKNVSQAAIMALHNEGFLKGVYFVADKEILTAGEIYSLMAQRSLPNTTRSPFPGIRISP